MVDANMIARRAFRNQLINVAASFNSITASHRLDPRYVIIGAQKAGTSSLLQYLLHHPQVSAPLTKETHFFDLHYRRGLRWYKGHFPLRCAREGQPQELTGEATPYYLYHPLVPERVRRAYPNMKLIVLLRNPVTRAYSHYQHERRRGFETVPFDVALEKEAARLRGAEKQISKTGVSFAHQHYSYLSRGIYVDQLRRWQEHFPKKQLLILKSEELFRRPQDILRSVFQFLGLTAVDLQISYKAHNQGRYEPMNASLRKRLEDFYRPHNERLYDWIGEDYGW